LSHSVCLFFDLCKNLIMEKKEPAKPKGKAAAAKTVDKFTQVQNVSLEHAKNRISHAVNTWLNSQQEFDENEKDAYLSGSWIV
jgi:hypothetical protein